jgi:alkylation response protein AidB-like acyl-CoA dehydrogenase
MIARAEVLADEMLFPAALSVDRADRVPEALIQLLIEQEFYAMAAPAEAGGLGTPDMGLAISTVESLSSGCLATAFVWIQHHGPVLAAAYSQEPGITQKWLRPLASGELRGGIARAGARQGGLRARRVPDGYLLDGVVPWVTGWDLIDVVHVAALDDTETVLFLMMDAVPSETLQVQLHDLVAARASRTVTLTFTNHLVPADRFTGSQPFADWQRSEAPGSALNGALALGVATRCRKLLGDDTTARQLHSEIDACRATLVKADATSTPAARAAASELAMRAAATLMIHTGSRSVLTDNPAQMLLREAGFLLVFGTRPLIRDALLARVTR